ncbi:MAG TPA: type 2 isopentenyl-diphosphate Delta-isomerase [Firmicutes bacterium]|nr:type 2 isopentenyl-diphosphate Delta-isomerase [Bacillota bacterium]
MKRSSETQRSQRKNEHIRWAVELADGPGRTGLGDVMLRPEAVPDLDSRAVDLSTTFLGLRFPFPLLINALTGGTGEAARINARLAQVAKATGLPMAVGSQRIALRDPGLTYTFTVVRRVNPHGVIFANLGAGSTPDEALRAVEMVEAQGLQLHLNAAQELSMAEGERAFYWSEAVAAVASHLPVPVIAKEVGCGLSGASAQRLLALGVKALDVGGKGGTNFVRIEEKRRRGRGSPFLDWGLPTAWSLLDVVGTCPGAEVCASGGLRSGLDMAKALALGARICGVARPLLTAVLTGGVKAGIRLVERWKRELRMSLVLAGARDLAELRRKPLIFTGETWNFIVQRRLTAYRKRARG